ncbi:hypothetical protein NN3_61410 [Nocardia neocaledoniensis NBRC 108232]|nr:hypothetical protein NN3_61410 [Nocardia neocaledoniensis NBRC 108232]
MSAEHIGNCAEPVPGTTNVAGTATATIAIARLIITLGIPLAAYTEQGPTAHAHLNAQFPRDYSSDESRWRGAVGARDVSAAGRPPAPR